MGKRVEAVYESGVIKPLKKLELEEGTRIVVEIKEGLADVIDKYSIKVNKDFLKEFLEERR